MSAAPDTKPGRRFGLPLQSPTVDEQGPLADIVHRNIRSLLEVRRELERKRNRQDRTADAITRFAGSMAFVYLHLGVVTAWIGLNLGLVPGFRPWDPYPFVMLAMGASVEAIFLSTFVLISQNRMQALADQRADLDLQINLLSEHEVTRLIQMVDALCRHMGVSEHKPDVEELKRSVAPELVLREIEQAHRHVLDQPAPWQAGSDE